MTVTMRMTEMTRMNGRSCDGTHRLKNKCIDENLSLIYQITTCGLVEFSAARTFPSCKTAKGK